MASFALNKKSKALLAQKENPKMISTPTRLRPSPLLTSSAAATKLGRNPLIIRRDRAGFSPRTAFSCKLSLRHQDSDFSQKIINGNTLKRLSNNKEVSASASASVSASASISAPVSASASASAQYIRMSADKVRRVIDQIRGRSYEQTLMILELMPYRACEPILKLLYSAAANGVHNLGLNEASLYIVRAEVNEGPVAKRFRFKARGRTHMIRRRTCHVTIVLKDMSVDGNGSF